MIAHHDNRQPGDAEAAAAIAAMTEWTPRPADRVRCELPLTGTFGEGIVVEVTPQRVVVDVNGETLWYHQHQLEFVGR